MVDSRGFIPKRISEHETEHHGSATDPNAAITNATLATALGAAPAAITGGDAPTEAEFLALRTMLVDNQAATKVLETKLNLALQALRDHGIIAP